MEEKILAVDDYEFYNLCLKESLEKSGFKGRIDLAGSTSEANKLIAESIIEQRPYNLALVDLKLGQDSGADLARRIIDICKVNTVIVTAYPDPAGNLPFSPDSFIIKPYNEKTISATVLKLLKPSRILSDDPKLVLNLWEATKHLYGINSLKPFSYKIDENQDVEKITGVAMKDRQVVNCTVYTQPDIEERIINIGLSATLGCTEKCQFCINWKCRKDKFGRESCYLRELTSDEIISQVYLAMISERVKKAFIDENFKVKVNFTCEGDAIVNNFENVMIAIAQLVQISLPEISIVVTTSGDENKLDDYLNKSSYIHFPRVGFYWSLTTANKEIRNRLMPGQKGRSLEKIRDKFREIGEKTKKPVTVNLVVIPGLTDRQEDADLLYSFLSDEKDSDDPFVYKVMALNSNSLPGVRNPTGEDVDGFCQKLVKAGIKPEKIRKRKVRGSDIAAGCGDCVPDRGIES